MSVHLVTSIDDVQQYLKGDDLVVIDAFGTWCSPCSMIAPRVARLAQEYSNVIFLKFDVDQSSNLSDRYKITSLPTFIFIKNGSEVDRVIGADYTQLVKTIKKNI